MQSSGGEFRIHPVILSGGSGTRLWPLSRQEFPKQVTRLFGGKSPLQETALRVSDDRLFAPPLCIANESHRFIVLEQLAQAGVPFSKLVLESVGRNTAPAAIVAALIVARDYPEAVMALLPSDHTIAGEAGFQRTMARAARAAQAGHIVTIGVAPDAPETGYGYLRKGEELADLEGTLRLAAFVEKPDILTAQSYLSSGDYFWNSGMFVMRASVLIEEAESHCPDIVSACREAVAGSARDLDFLRLDPRAFSKSKSISIDYAIMEKTSRGTIVPAEFSWSDAGAWHAVWALSPKDGQGNAVLAKRSYFSDTSNCYLRSEDGRLLAGIGLENLCIVSTRDAVLVLPKDRAPELGAFVDRMSKEGAVETVAPPVIHRPWGSYEVLDGGQGFVVKRIVVKPGGKLSLQYHHHRSEHWVVVAGKARVTRGEEQTVLGPNQSVHISVGQPHRLENPFDTPLVLIEVQCGGYLDEDDIVRLEDTYGRWAGRGTEDAAMRAPSKAEVDQE